jgi:hypothetical protein
MQPRARSAGEHESFDARWVHVDLGDFTECGRENAPHGTNKGQGTPWTRVSATSPLTVLSGAMHDLVEQAEEGYVRKGSTYSR